MRQDVVEELDKALLDGREQILEESSRIFLDQLISLLGFIDDLPDQIEREVHQDQDGFHHDHDDLDDELDQPQDRFAELVDDPHEAIDRMNQVVDAE